MNPELIFELNKFNGIIFNELPHTYNYNGLDCRSVTNILGDYKKDFDKEKMAFFYGRKHNISVYDVLDMWDTERERSCNVGSHVHKYMELSFNGKLYTESEDNLPGSLVSICDQFIKQSKNKLIPVKSEFIVGDFNKAICGMIDQIFYNVKAGEYQIWDWKTNKKMRSSSEFGNKMINGLGNLDECEMNTYSLQLAMYKKIIQENTNIVLGDSYICWINEAQMFPKVIKTFDFQKEIDLIWSKLAA